MSRKHREKGAKRTARGDAHQRGPIDAPSAAPPTPAGGSDSGLAGSFSRALIRCAVGAVLVLAGVAKLPDTRWLFLAIQDLAPGLGVVGTSIASYVVPWTELIVGGCLVLGIATRGAAIAALALFISFALGISSAILSGAAVDCPCFGSLSLVCSGPLGACHLLRSALLAMLCALVVQIGPGAWSPSSLARRAPT